MQQSPSSSQSQASEASRDAGRRMDAIGDQTRRLDPYLEAVPKTVHAVSTLNDTTLKTLSTFQDEWLKIAKQRWSENLELMHRLSETPMGFSRAYADYWSKVVTQFSDDAREIGQMSKDTANETAKNVGQAFKQNAQDMQKAVNTATSDNKAQGSSQHR